MLKVKALDGMDCPFCKMSQGSERLVWNGSHILVALSNPRLMKGHLLVIPKRHIEKLSELNQEERKEMVETVIEFQEKILLKLSMGCDVRQHYRPFLKEGRLKVTHLHVHLQPRMLQDELYQKSQKHETEIFQPLPQNEIQELQVLFES